MAKNSYRVIAPDRYLEVREEPSSVTVRAGDDVVARSEGAVWLKEGDRPEVLYVPLDDVDRHRLVPSDTTFGCRWKGAASYFHVDLVDRTLNDVVWCYPDAPERIAALRDRVAFDRSAFAIDVAPSRELSGESAEGWPDAVDGAPAARTEEARADEWPSGSPDRRAGFPRTGDRVGDQVFGE